MGDGAQCTCESLFTYGWVVLGGIISIVWSRILVSRQKVQMTGLNLLIFFSFFQVGQPLVKETTVIN